MVVESMLKTIRSFQRSYNRMQMRWEQALLRSGYCMPEIKVLFELRVVGVCTKRELTSRVCLSMEQTALVLTKLQQWGKILIEHDEHDMQMDYVRLTMCGKEEVIRLQGLYENILLSDMEFLSMKEQIELMMHLEKLKVVFEGIVKRDVCEVEEGVMSDEW